MEWGGTEDGPARPAARLSRPATLVVPGIAAAGTLAALLYLIPVEFSLRSAVLWSLSAALAVAASFLHLRHAVAAVLATAAPIVGVLWSATILRLAGYPDSGQFLACAYGLVVAALLARDTLGRLVSDEGRGNAARAALRAQARSVIAATAAGALAILMAARSHAAAAALAALLDLAAATFFSTVVLARLLAFVEPDETFVAKWNRIRELRVARAWRASMVAVPRWGLSVSGIALVSAVLALFGSPLALPEGSEWIAQALLGTGFVLAAAYLVTAAWRDALALSLCLGLSGLYAGLSIWPGTAWNGALWFDVMRLNAIPILCAAMMAHEARRWRDAGEEDSIARLRGVEEAASAIAFAALAGFACLLPWIGDMAPCTALLLLPAGVASAIFFEPALASAIETLLPRRRSVEDLYTRR